MLVKCPNCGSSSSLDALVDNQDAAKALALAFSLSNIGGSLVKYLGLFRPKKSQLSFGRVATLLDEIVPMIEKQAIRRDGKTYTVPTQVWESAINKLLQQRDLNKLTLPLKSHGYLFETVLTELEKIETTHGYSAPESMPEPLYTAPETTQLPAELIELDKQNAEKYAEQKRLEEEREKEANRKHLEWLQQMEAEQLKRQEAAQHTSVNDVSMKPRFSDGGIVPYHRANDLKTNLFKGGMSSADLREVERELTRGAVNAGDIAKELFGE